MMTEVLVWAFISESGRDVLKEWAEDVRLPTRVRAKLDQKVDLLRQQPFENLIHSHMLAGPVHKLGHIYKLRLNGEIAARPMLCRGPRGGESAYTLLLGAVERDGRYVPHEAPERAAENRALLLACPERRRKYEGLGKASH